MNLGGYKFKISRFEKILNYLLMLNLSLTVFFSALSGIMNHFWTGWLYEDHQYVFEGITAEDRPIFTLKAFFSFYLIVNSFVPLDLIAGIAISKLVYTGLIEADAWMMEADYLMKDVKKAKCNTYNLHEELGQVEYLFCDKTGTLTKNELVFRTMGLPSGKVTEFATDCIDFKDLKKNLCKGEADEEAQLEAFFRCITLNHDCISVESKARKSGIAYNGPSIDEVCLLDMSQSANVLEFMDRDSEAYFLKNMITGKDEKYKLIKIFEFESVRKCMTVIVQDEAGKYWAYCKGADSSILPKITHTLKE
jgi:magnesium-transporting ATPase (P-type)